jgi:hypothetical protein
MYFKLYLGCVFTVTFITFSGCRDKPRVIVKKMPFNRSLYYSAPMGVITDLKSIAPESDPNRYITICDRKSKHILNSQTGKLERIEKFGHDVNIRTLYK